LPNPRLFMEVLLAPDDPAWEPEKVPYRGTQRWDGGEFATYPSRMGKAKFTKLRLRGQTGLLDSTEPYIDTRANAPHHSALVGELEDFLQTWLYFGLLAEFLGLNSATYCGHGSEAVETLYGNCLQYHQDLPFINGHGVRVLVAFIQLRVAEISTIDHPRWERLDSCLQLSFDILVLHRGDIDHLLLYSIASLSDGLRRIWWMSITRRDTNWSANPALSTREPWGMLCSRGLGPRLLQHGWCPSEIARVNDKPGGLDAFHYFTRLKKPKPWLDHASCTAHVCMALQAKVVSLSASHHRPHCECHEITVDSTAIHRILESTPYYPVLRFHRNPRSDTAFELIVEQYTPGVPYVALSHVMAHSLGSYLVKRLTQDAGLDRRSGKLDAQHATHMSSCKAVPASGTTTKGN
jgi:hypothetical protein